MNNKSSSGSPISSSKSHNKNNSAERLRGVQQESAQAAQQTEPSTEFFEANGSPQDTDLAKKKREKVFKKPTGLS